MSDADQRLAAAQMQGVIDAYSERYVTTIMDAAYETIGQLPAESQAVMRAWAASLVLAGMEAPRYFHEVCGVRDVDLLRGCLFAAIERMRQATNLPPQAMVN